MQNSLRQDGDIGHVDLGKVALAGTSLKLADGMDERSTLDISHGAAFPPCERTLVTSLRIRTHLAR